MGMTLQAACSPVEAGDGCVWSGVPLWPGIPTCTEELLGGGALRGLREGREWSFICWASSLSVGQMLGRCGAVCRLFCLSVLPRWLAYLGVYKFKSFL